MEVETLRLVARIGAASLGAPGMLCAIWWASRNLRRGPRCFCPGPRRSTLWRAFPPAWFFIRPCGYDLRGLPTHEDLSVTCPECGRSLRPDRTALRRVFRWRAGRAACVLLLLALLTTSPYLLKTTSWQRHMPTTALIWGKRLLGTAHMPTRLRRELERRIELGRLSERQQDWVIPALAADLRNDGEPRNAVRAESLLIWLGKKGRAQLERSLRSPDTQERRLAGETLRATFIEWEETIDRGWQHPRLVGTPSDDLLHVTLENLDFWSEWTTGLEHAGDPYAFLALFPERVTPMVSTGLDSTDERSRLRCAGLAVLIRDPDLLPRAVPILIEHFKDNREYRDARYAAVAICSMGSDAESYLLPFLYSSDRQQRALARLVFQNLRKPPPEARANVDSSFFNVTQGPPRPDFP